MREAFPKMRRTKYLPATVNPKQEAFLSLTCREALFGGAAYGSKTWALLMGAIQFVDIPGYSALILRKHSTDLYKSKGLVDTAESWLRGTDARWNGGRKRWTFPTTGDPAIIEFGHFDTKASGQGVFGVSGTTYQYIGIDELTEFEENEYKFLFRSLRKPEGMTIPLRMRAGTNPIGRGAVWVKQHFITEGRQNGRVFMPSKIDDNLYGDKPEYVKSLMSLDPYTRAQLLDGNWDAKPPGSKFRREWFKRMPVAPAKEMPWVRFWDLAATEPGPGKDPSWTAGVKMAHDGSMFYIADVRRDRLSPKGVEDLVIATAEEDAQWANDMHIRMEQEGGSGGKNTIAHYMTLLNKYSFKGFSVSGRGSKEIRANPLSSQAEAGNVILIQGPWISAFLDEIEQFPGGQYADQVDAASGAYWCLTEEELTGTLDDLFLGEELPRPDW